MHSSLPSSHYSLLHPWIVGSHPFIPLLVFLTMLSMCGAPPPRPVTSNDQPTSRWPTLPPTAATTTPPLALPTPFAKPAVAQAGWQRRWLHGEPCRAPCWEGITPGQTTIAEAVRLLNEKPFITELRNGERYWAQEDDTVSWGWADPMVEGGGWVAYPQRAAPHHDTVPVNSIQVRPYDTILYLHEVMAAYGEPSHIVPFDGYAPVGGLAYRTVGLIVVYLPQGFYLTASALDRSTKITGDLNVGVTVTFFAPNAGGLDAALRNLQHDWPSGWDSKDLIPWQGFKEVASYCQLAQSVPHNLCE